MLSARTILVLSALLLMVVTTCTAFAATAAPLRVMSYNIHHGEGTDNRFDLPGIAALVRDNGVDIAGFQEVDQRTTRSMLVDQVAEIGKVLGYNYVYTPHFPYRGGNYGLGLVSRYPIVAHKSHPLPTGPGAESKSMLQATIDINGTLIDVFVIHFEVSVATVRQAQADWAAAIAAKAKNPALLMGDFNATPESLVTAPFRYIMLDSHATARYLAPASLMEKDPPALRTYAAGGFTFPSDAPKNRADYIWMSPQWRPVPGELVQSIQSKRSDHTAVVATLEIQTEPLPAANLPATWNATSQAVVFMPPTVAQWLARNGKNAEDMGNALAVWLTEAGLQTQVVSAVTEIPTGSLVVLPGGRYLSETDAAALKAHVNAGGALIAWGDASVESGENLNRPLAQTLGIEYVGWSTGFPTRGQLVVTPENVTQTGLPAITKFWSMEGPVVRVLPGARVLGTWLDNRGTVPSHPEAFNAGLVHNGRTMYVAFNPFQLNDKDNPDTKALVQSLARYLAAARL